MDSRPLKLNLMLMAMIPLWKNKQGISAWLVEGRALQRKSHLCVPFRGSARPRSQFPHSCVCERFIYSQDRSTCFLQQNRQINRGNIYKSLTGTWMWKSGLWPHNSFSGNICLEFSVLVLWSEERQSCTLTRLHPTEAGRRLRKTARLSSCQGAHPAPVGLSFYVFSCDNLSEWRRQQHAIAYGRGFSSFSSQKATNQSSTQADECFAIGYTAICCWP